LKRIAIITIALAVWALTAAAPAAEARTLENSVVAVTSEGETCPQCGYENEAGLKFCIQCGTPLTDASRAAEVMCPNCKARMPYGATYCAECGRALVKETGPPPRMFFGTVAGGVMSGKDARPEFWYRFSNRHPIVISFSFGARVKEYLAVSFASGYEYWWDNFDFAYMGVADVYRDSQRTIPLLAKGKVFLPNRRFAPGGYAEFGYGISTLKGECDFTELGYEEGINSLIIGFGGGFDIFATRNFGFLVEIGWRRQSTPDPFQDLSYFRGTGGVFF